MQHLVLPIPLTCGSNNEAICRDEDSRVRWCEVGKPWRHINNTKKSAGRLTVSILRVVSARECRDRRCISFRPVILARECVADLFALSQYLPEMSMS